MRFTFFILLVIFSTSCSKKLSTMKHADLTFDWQGHRGARGILPENTIPAFLKALDYPVKTLELDIAISKENEVIVSHEPWFNHAISSKPDGTHITEAEEKNFKIYEMTYAEIKTFDVGARGNERFPDQQPMKVHKPSLQDLVDAVNDFCKKNNRARPFYNIEIKSQPDYYGKFTPQPEEYVRLVLKAIKKAGIRKQCNLQSFDTNILNEIKKQDASVVVAYLIYNKDTPAENLKKINFKPEIYSPYFLLLNKEVVADFHKKGIQVIPWTVNTQEEMQKMIDIGVDGIITDYPNYIELTRY